MNSLNAGNAGVTSSIKSLRSPHHRKIFKALALFAALGFAPLAVAEEFLGVEPASKDGAAEPLKSPKGPAATKVAPTAPIASGDDSSLNGFGGLNAIHGSSRLSGGVDGFNAEVTIGYFFNPYVSIDTTGRFARLDGTSHSGDQYGPEVDLVFRGPNPTILTPFFGAGPGYSQWTRKVDGEIIDRSHSWTGAVFGGLYVRLTRHFGLTAERRRIAYFNDPPFSYDAPDDGASRAREPRYATSDHIGFALSF